MFFRYNIAEIDRKNLSEPVRELLELLVLENKIAAVKNKLFALKKIQYTRQLDEVQKKMEEASVFLNDKKKELEELLALVKNQKKAINKHQK